MNKKFKVLATRPITCAAVIGMFLAVQPAAATTVVSSSAFGLSTNLGLLGFVGVSIAPVAPASGVAAPAYNASNSVASVNQTLALGTPALAAVKEAVSTGLLVSTTKSTMPISAFGTASASVNQLATGLSTKLALVPAVDIFSIGATTVQSTSSVFGNGALSVAGSSHIEGLTVSGLALGGLVIDGSAFVDPLPNTILVNLLGLRVILNEQLVSGNGSATLGLVTNAIHVYFDSFAVGGGVLNGNIIVADSAADISGGAIAALPEPAVWIQMLAGFVLVGVGIRGRRGAADRVALNV
jgi:hypothetical protein